MFATNKWNQQLNGVHFLKNALKKHLELCFSKGVGTNAHMVCCSVIRLHGPWWMVWDSLGEICMWWNFDCQKISERMCECFCKNILYASKSALRVASFSKLNMRAMLKLWWYSIYYSSIVKVSGLTLSQPLMLLLANVAIIQEKMAPLTGVFFSRAK